MFGQRVVSCTIATHCVLSSHQNLADKSPYKGPVYEPVAFPAHISQVLREAMEQEQFS